VTEREPRWNAGAVGRIPEDDALVWRDDAMTGPQFYAASESEAAVAAKQLNLVQDERDRYHAALVALSDMMGPKGREAFVMLGPRMFSAALEVVQEALK